MLVTDGHLRLVAEVVERELRACVTQWREMAALQVPLAHQMLSKLLVEKWSAHRSATRASTTTTSAPTSGRAGNHVTATSPGTRLLECSPGAEGGPAVLGGDQVGLRFWHRGGSRRQHLDDGSFRRRRRLRSGSRHV